MKLWSCQAQGCRAAVRVSTSIRELALPEDLRLDPGHFKTKQKSVTTERTGSDQRQEQRENSKGKAGVQGMYHMV